MLDYIKQTLIGQYEASLAMLNRCIEACPIDHWENKIGNGTFRWVAYHTLFFVDLYLSRTAESFELRDVHEHGGDERGPDACVGLDKNELLSYVQICRQKALSSIAEESENSLAGPSGFSWYEISRGEMHLVNIRHIQHHTGQLSAYLRRNVPECKDRRALGWIGAGWW
jgi:hypothetical protein